MDVDDLEKLYQKTGRKNVEMTRSGHTEYAEGCTKKDIAATMGPALPTSSPSKIAVPGGAVGEDERGSAEEKPEAVPLVWHKRKGREVAKKQRTTSA